MNYLPQWTERSPKRGIDPLGIQNSGVQLYQKLLPGISNVTLRARYYGLYCWANETYAREIGSVDGNDWRNFIRSLEALHALVAFQFGESGGVAGVEWAERTLRREGSVVDFSEGASTDQTADRYLQQSFGIYGQAYLSQLDALDLFDTKSAENHSLPTRTEQGLTLANAFRDSIGPEVEALVVKAVKANKVSRDDLSRMSAILPSQVGNGPERDLIETLLFARLPTARPEDQSRSQSLSLVLHVANHLGRLPRQEDVRQILFENDLPLPQQLELQRLNWEVYQVQDMWQVAAATTLNWAISVMNEFDDGQTLTEIQAEVVMRLRERWPEQSKMNWQEFWKACPLASREVSDRWLSLVARRGSAEDRTLAAFELMGCLAHRVETRADLRVQISEALNKHGNGRSIYTELNWLAANPETLIPELMAAYVGQRVLARHIWVATQKMRRQNDYTFLFEPRDGRLAYRSQYQPVATAPRLGPAIRYLQDIHLLDDNGITDRGIAVMNGTV